ncbi:MAG TPA: hypothetical protein PKV33_02975 [Methanothrix sp.]|nr:hypothetical protein [Methanothrix sp.]
MQNKKDKRTKDVVVKATSDVGKSVASGSADAKKGAANLGKKGTPGKGDARKGWKK